MKLTRTTDPGMHPAVDFATRWLAGASAITALLLAGPASGTPQGELDPAFGENGRLLVLGHSPSFNPYVNAVARQVDGKILLSTGLTVSRLNPDGSWDDSFGEDGTASIELFEHGYFGVNDMAVQPDGKIILAGHLATDWLGGTYDPGALTRLNPDGTIDSTFGTDGGVELHLGGWLESISRVVVLDDGRIVVAGTTSGNGGSRAMFARFEADGTLDATFGTGPLGGTTLVGSNGSSYQAKWMDRQPDGKFVACGTSGPYSAEASNLLIRIAADGAVDSTFGADGVSLIAKGTAAHDTRCLAMTDGTTVLAGNSGEYGKVDLILARVTQDGVVDAGFGDGGISRIDLEGKEYLESIVLLADGQLGVCGRAVTGHDDQPMSLMLVGRIDSASGLADPGFGNEGVTMVDFGNGHYVSRFRRGRLLQQADGMLVAVGFTESFTTIGDHWGPTAFALARVDPEGVGHAGFVGIAGPAAIRTTGADGPIEAAAVVRRTGGSTGPLSVDFGTVGNTAQAPIDFTAKSGTLTWADGETDTKSIAVPVSATGAGLFDIQLSNSTGGLATSLVTVSLPPPSGGSDGEGSGSGGARSGGGAMTAVDLLAMLAMFAGYGVMRRRLHAAAARAISETSR